MVRLAEIDDAEQLAALNDEFNGKGETSLEHIRESLRGNPQEVVVVDEEDGVLTGFICVQLKRSFCYDECMPEITEVYVRPAYRRQGVARRMLAFAEARCRAICPCRELTLLTGQDNRAAQAVYAALGYAADGEIHLVKEMK
ncbi:MAG: GNAT family N-acetyltransferase [Eubacteriales bacterium]|nr:GNAT family N-acetyltransferase [Eubacteriales bacterium]